MHFAVTTAQGQRLACKTDFTVVMAEHHSFDPRGVSCPDCQNSEEFKKAQRTLRDAIRKTSGKGVVRG